MLGALGWGHLWDHPPPHALSPNSFTVAVKESYAKPHIVTSTEPCTGTPGLPQSCPQQR